MLRARAAKNPDALPPESVGRARLSVAGTGDRQRRRSADRRLLDRRAHLRAGDRPESRSLRADRRRHRHERDPGRSSRRRRKRIPRRRRSWTPILARALTPDLAQRQQSAAALAAELRSVAAVLDVRTGDATPRPRSCRLTISPDRNAAGLLAGALVVAAAAAGGRLVVAEPVARCQCQSQSRLRNAIASSPNSAVGIRPRIQQRPASAPDEQSLCIDVGAGQDHRDVAPQLDLTAEHRRRARGGGPLDQQVLVASRRRQGRGAAAARRPRRSGRRARGRCRA